MLRFLIVLFMFPVTQALAQIEITWKTLQDVKFKDKYLEELDDYFSYPIYGESIKKLEGEKLSIKGHVIPIDPDLGLFVLSQNPYSACFFCGQSGPESVVEFELKPGYPELETDQVVTLEGRLRLNYNDIYQCYYIFEKAKVHLK